MNYYTDPNAWLEYNIRECPDGTRRCLACADRDHHACYGTGCECGGEQV